MVNRFAQAASLAYGRPPQKNCSDIIPLLASKSLSFILFGVPGLKKTLVSVAVLVAMSVAIVSCGGGGSSSTTQKASGLSYRAFVSNPLYPNSSLEQPGAEHRQRHQRCPLSIRRQLVGEPGATRNDGRGAGAEIYLGLQSGRKRHRGGR